VSVGSPFCSAWKDRWLSLSEDLLPTATGIAEFTACEWRIRILG